MAATKKLSEVLKDYPDFKPGWTLYGADGNEIPGGWVAKSHFGSVEHVVVMHDDGTPNFDRPAYEESPAVNVIAFGIRWEKSWFSGWKRRVHVAILKQPRHHADDPLNQNTDGHPPVVIGQIPMGFAEKILGGKFESAEDAARREVIEEARATAVLGVFRPPCPWHNPNPTFVKSWTDVLFVEVDLRRIAELKTTRNEPIYSADYVDLEEVERRIHEGVHDGAYYRAATTLSALYMFRVWFRRQYG